MTHRLLPKLDAGTDDTTPGIRLSSSGSSMRTQDDSAFPFQTISSGAQLGRSGTLLHLGLSLFWFHSWTLIVSG